MSGQDPFAEAFQFANPTQCDKHDLGSDIDQTLFDGFFESQVFLAWSSGSKSWQLHCYGSPGCGKTTLAAVAATRLRNRDKTFGNVASVFITKPPVSDSLTFVEDVLGSILQQVDSPDSERIANYRTVCKEGLPAVERMNTLRECLRHYLHSQHAFLILDGLDYFGAALQYVLRAELVNLQDQGLRIMLTTRLPDYTIAPDNTSCDGCHSEESLKLFWTCMKCKPMGNYFDICYDCKEKKQPCHYCEDCLSHEEDYRHVSVKIGGFPLKRYVRDVLKREYGPLGRGLNDKMTYITQNAPDNIALTRLFLAKTLEQDSIQETSLNMVEDRLPATVIEYFNTELSAIEHLAEIPRSIALRAIVVAATDDTGVPASELYNRIGMHDNIESRTERPRGIEDILKAASGWLVEQGTNDRRIATYCPVFSLYVKENYNDWLFKARVSLGYETGQRAEDKETPSGGDTSIDTRLASSKTTGIVIPDWSTSSGSQETASSSRTSALSMSDTRSTNTSATSQTTLMSRMSMAVIVPDLQGRLTSTPPRMNSDESVNSPIQPIAKAINESFAPKSKRSICNFCQQQILNSTKQSGPHLPTPYSAAGSHLNCVFCDLLYSNSDPTETSEVISSAWPRYRWTLQSSVTIGGKNESATLTFRPLHRGLPTRRFQFLQTRQSDAINRDIGISTNPNTVGSSAGPQIQKWIQNCDNYHHNCPKYSPSGFIPTRLLDVGTGQNDMIRLVDTAVSKIKAPYCTLSHAWGTSKIPTSTMWNLPELLVIGKRFDELSKNFQDAVRLTQFLGMRYIWIDSFCIVQDPPGVDFKKEGALMHKVYRNSYCNFVAAHANGGEGGLFRDRLPEDVLPIEYKGDGQNGLLGTKEWQIAPRDMWESELLGSFIYTRGWVFQERMLSPRLLHFAANQVFWDCGSFSACEGFPAGLPSSLDDVAATDRHWRGRLEHAKNTTTMVPSEIDYESPYSFWMSAVEKYTACNLTSQGDKTIAIWSVAKVLRDILQEEYAYGMWEHHLAEQLCWKVKDYRVAKRVALLQTNFPSWSWATIKGEILPRHRLTIRDYHAKNHDVDPLAFSLNKSTAATPSVTTPAAAEDRDQEPILEDKALAVLSYLGTGKLQPNIANRRNDGSIDTDVSDYSFVVQMDGDHQAMWTAFPDESPNDWFEEENLGLTYAILTASGSPTQPYSGVGVMLMESAAWYRLLLKKLANLQHQEQCSQDQDSKKEMNKEIEYLSQLVASAGIDKGQMSQQRYRRMGIVEFKDMEQSSWNWLQREGFQKFWLE